MEINYKFMGADPRVMLLDYYICDNVLSMQKWCDLEDCESIVIGFEVISTLKLTMDQNYFVAESLILCCGMIMWQLCANEFDFVTYVRRWIFSCACCSPSNKTY